MTERTLVLIKPDAVRRGLTGRILDRYLAKGYGLVAMELRLCTAEQADAHYADHVEKAWYPPLRDFVTSGPLVAAVLEGDRVIEAVRALNGATDGIAAQLRLSVETGPPTARTSCTARVRCPRSPCGSPGCPRDRPAAHPSGTPL